jgi:zinc/manganese transport system permease protein
MIATWLGIVMAYMSYEWPPHGRGWPVSFFIALLILIFYLLARTIPRRIRMIRQSL